MNLLGLFERMPLSVRVPILVAILMVVISAVISERVLDRLTRTQETSLQSLAEAYLDGLSSSVVPAVLREDIWEVYDALDRSSAIYRSLAPLDTVVTNSQGRVLAASDPLEFQSFSTLPSAYELKFRPDRVLIDEGSSVGFALRNLSHQDQKIGAIYATFDVSHLFAERRSVLITLLLTNGMLAALFALGGFLLTRQMIKPMRTLERHMRNAETGSPEPIPVEDMPRGDGEVASLFHGYNTLVRSERERANLAVRLAEEEKLSSLGRLASGMAHEINNPLGGLFNALDTLKRHGQRQDVRAASIRLIERGLAGIRDVVEAALATYRPERSKTPLKEEDLDDLRLLVRSELHRKRLRLNWDVDWKGPETAAVPAGPVRQAVLNLLLNAIAATPEGGSIAVTVRMDPHLVSIAVADEGSGLPPEYAGILSKRELGPGTPVGRGLGLWMVRRVCDEMGGSVSVEQAAPRGTLVRLLLPAERKGEQAHAA